MFKKGRVTEIASAVTVDNGTPVVEVKSDGTFTIQDHNARVGDTLTIGVTVYTFAAAAGAAYTVVIGAAATNSLDNLIAAITYDGGAGTNEGVLYGTGTVAHPDAGAAAGAADTIDVTALVAGVAGNAIVTTSTMVDGTWGAATLENGADAIAALGGLDLNAYISDGETSVLGSTTYTFKTVLTGAADEVLIGATVSDSIDNLVSAVMATAGEGVTYGTGTVANTEATLAVGAGDTADATAVAAGVAGDSVASTETLADGAWGAATLAGGVDEVAATEALTFAANLTATDTVTIGSTVYTLVATLSTGPTVAYEVEVGGVVQNTLDNLLAAINGGAGEGVVYGVGTVAHPDVTGVDGTGDVIDITAIVAGTAANSIATTETSGTASWGGATMSGGVDNVQSTQTLTIEVNAINNETATLEGDAYTWKDTLTGAADEVLIGADASASLDNFIAAVNGAAGEGVTYGTGTTAHTTIDASAGAGDTIIWTATTAGAAGNALTTTETMTKGEMDGATLAGGADAIAATGIITILSGGNLHAAETVTIDATVYTAIAALTVPAVPYEVLIGATASDSLDNLIAAINAAAGAGSTYGTGTVAHPTHDAAVGAGDTMDVTATLGGTDGDVASTETAVDGSWGAANTTGGVDRSGFDFSWSKAERFLLEVKITGTGAIEADVLLYGYDNEGPLGDLGFWAKQGAGSDPGHVNGGTVIGGTTLVAWRNAISRFDDHSGDSLYCEIDNISGTSATVTVTMTELIEF